MKRAHLKRNLRQIAFFATVWLFAALLYALVEFGLLGRLDYYPSTSNPYDFANALIYTVSGSFVMGLLQGSFEVLWLKRLFRRRPLWFKVIFKSLLYLFMICLFIIILAVLTNTQRLKVGLADPIIADNLAAFLSRFAFWSVVIYVGAILLVAMLLSEVSQYLGPGMLSNFFIGKYHKPFREQRIFMFLDMNDSTTLAESLGHEKYFALLRAYYAEMSDPILSNYGEIYHYVGDEVVVSWNLKEGLEKGRCLQCFQEITNRLESRESYFLDRYGAAPGCKAAFHLGEVTTGEIGELKKALIHTGDVLNTTARILGRCHEFEARALVSGKLKRALPENNWNFKRVGTVNLKGKTEDTELYKVVWAD